jgi:hypothetical protein
MDLTRNPAELRRLPLRAALRGPARRVMEAGLQRDRVRR